VPFQPLLVLPAKAKQGDTRRPGGTEFASCEPRNVGYRACHFGPPVALWLH
jgi:hypothetical protein